VLVAALSDCKASGCRQGQAARNHLGQRGNSSGWPRCDESQQTETVSLLVKRLLHLLLGPALARGGKDWRVAQPWPPMSSGEPKPRRQPTA